MGKKCINLKKLNELTNPFSLVTYPYWGMFNVNTSITFPSLTVDKKSINCYLKHACGTFFRVSEGSIVLFTLPSASQHTSSRALSPKHREYLRE